MRAGSAALLVPLVLAAGGRAALAAGPSKQECVAANDAAQELRRDGKLIEARTKLAQCAAAACPGLVREDCAQRLTEVDGAMPSIVFEAKDASGNDLAAVQVSVDGQPLAAKLDGSAVQVDPGEHQFAFDDADGFAHVDKTIVVREGDKGRHVAVVFGAPTPATQPQGAAATAEAGGSRRTIGLTLGAVGVAGLVAGGIFGGLALATKARLDGADGCSKGQCPSTGNAPNDRSALQTQAILADVGFGAGALGLALGAYLFLSASPGEGARAAAMVVPWVGPGSAGLSGRFQ